MSDLDAARRQTIQTLTNEIKRLDDPQRNKEFELLREKWRRQQGTIGMLQEKLRQQSATDKEAMEALEAIYTSARGDEKGQSWAIRKFLDDRGIFNDDIQGAKRLIEMVCKHVLEQKS